MINLYLLEDAYGFGNRLLMWNAWYNFLSNQDEDFTIYVCRKNQFKELDYFNYPKTKHGCSGLSYYGRKKKFKGDLTFPKNQPCECESSILKLTELSTNTTEKVGSGDYIAIDGMNFNTDFYSENSFYDGKTGYNTFNFPLQSITSKNKEYFNKIKSRLKNVVGVHFRRGDIHNDGHGLFLDLDYYTNLMDKILEYNPNQEFYLSTDGEFSEVEYLHTRYNIITSEDFGYKPHYKYMRYPCTFPKFSEPDFTDILGLRSCLGIIPSKSTWSDVCIYWSNIYRIENLNHIEVLFNNKLLDANGNPYGERNNHGDWVNMDKGE